MRFRIAFGLVFCALASLTARPGWAQQEKAEMQVSQDGGVSLPIDVVFCIDGPTVGVNHGLSDVQGFIAQVISGFAQCSDANNLRVGRVLYGLRKPAPLENYEVIPLNKQWNSVQAGLETVHDEQAYNDELLRNTDYATHEPGTGKITQLVTDKMNWRQGSYKAVYFIGYEPIVRDYAATLSAVNAARAKGIHINSAFLGRPGHIDELWGEQALGRSRMLPLLCAPLPGPVEVHVRGELTEAFKQSLNKWRQMAGLGKGHFFLFDTSEPRRVSVQANDGNNLFVAQGFEHARPGELQQARLNRLSERYETQLRQLYKQFWGTYLPYGTNVLERRGYLAMYAINTGLEGEIPEEGKYFEPVAPIVHSMDTDNSQWDLVDAARTGVLDWQQVDKETVPPEMQDMDEARCEEYLTVVFARRTELAEATLLLQQQWQKDLAAALTISVSRAPAQK